MYTLIKNERQVLRLSPGVVWCRIVVRIKKWDSIMQEIQKEAKKKKPHAKVDNFRKSVSKNKGGKPFAKGL